jgi:hypothetical protein
MRWGVKVAVALVLVLAAMPANALATPPANDDFANRQVLPAGFPGGLPVEESGSNVEATKETGENISPFAAGHSVWFEWEAETTEWVTVGVCDSDFAALIGVFTGSELTSLTKMASGNSAEGPHCFNEREYTFKASSGTKYVIGVDGNAFTPLPEFTPDTEGEVVLRIESTPPPPNDDFANAADLTAAGQVYEFEPGAERFYFARLEGYDWNASKEVGEPEHEGDPGGASVWYRWTAPETGLVHLSACCVAGPLIGLYTGSSVDALAPVPFNSEIWPEKQAQVVAGQTYMIAVDGVYDESSGEAAQFSFSINASMSLPAKDTETPNPFESIPPPPDTFAPETMIDKSRFRISTRTATFWFSASEATQGFLCRLDKGEFKPCGSPRTYKRLKPGKHAFRVKGVDVAGNVDSSAAVAKFKIPKPHHGRR